MRQHNRRAQRHEIRVNVRYRFGPDQEWHSCRLIDLSKLGAAIEIFDVVSTEALTGPLVIDLGVDDVVGLGTHLRAAVRSIGPGPTHGIRIGAEFPDPTEWERTLLHRVLSSPLVSGPDGPTPLVLTDSRTDTSPT